MEMKGNITAKEMLTKIEAYREKYQLSKANLVRKAIFELVERNKA